MLSLFLPTVSYGHDILIQNLTSPPVRLNVYIENGKFDCVYLQGNIVNDALIKSGESLYANVSVVKRDNCEAQSPSKGDVIIEFFDQTKSQKYGGYRYARFGGGTSSGINPGKDCYGYLPFLLSSKYPDSKTAILKMEYSSRSYSGRYECKY